MNSAVSRAETPMPPAAVGASAGFDSPEVLILCRDCDGKRSWFAVERGNRGYGKALLWRAAKRGDRILTGRPVLVAGACSCPEKGRAR